jgi:hypothetical protein
MTQGIVTDDVPGVVLATPFLESAPPRFGKYHELTNPILTD